MKIIVIICLTLFSVLTLAHTKFDVIAPKGLEPQIELFLLSAAAEDFNNSREILPSGFRNIRVGYVVTSADEKQYFLCGQFLLLKENKHEEWVPFVTIKTESYEQWIGGQSEGLCQRPSIIWDRHEDLSQKLLAKFQSAK